MKRKKIILPAVLAAAALLVTAGLLFYTGVWQWNRPSEETYPIRGVDVSHFQGKIDWDVLAGEDIRFAYIKATEGTSFVDERFAENWAGAAETPLRIGAYHFFSFESAGDSQAEHFIRTVVPAADMMPPAVDVEPYGQHGELTADVLAELGTLLRLLEAHYGTKPILYTTAAYAEPVHTAFPENGIWLRSIFGRPDGSIPWVLWQFSNRTKLRGYDGEERFIDVNVFAGTEDDFRHFGE